jgi:hypothetical protein
VRITTTFATALLLASPVFGHHSDAGLDMESIVTFAGTVTEFNWRNPHVYFTVETTDERGDQVEWALQMGSTITVTRMGWNRESLSIGDRVTVGAHPAQNGRPYALLNSIEKEGGIVLPTAFFSTSGEPRLAAPEVTASTSTLEGRWMADASKLVSYPGGFDGFFRAQLSFTEKGKGAQAAYDELSDENPESTCVGRPTPGMIVSTGLYPLEIQVDEEEEIIVIRSEFFDEERTVYMDGRGHPPEDGERILTGHSIGRWEGDVLVVDTRNFADHRSPYQIGVPSGAQKHVVERYRLTEDGTRIVVEFMLEDPEYITQPMTHTRELIYSPHMEMSRFDCDVESTRRFVPQSG